MPKMKPGKDQGNAALPKLGSPWTSKHSQDLLKYNAVDDHAAHPMSMRGPLDKGHPMKKYGPLSSHGIGGTHPDPKLKKEGEAQTSVSTSGDTTTTTTTQRVSGTGETGGFASGTGYDLDEVIVGLDTDSSSTTNAPRISSTGQEVTTLAKNLLRKEKITKRISNFTKHKRKNIFKIQEIGQVLTKTK
jgi:hypothetical protein